ncbi:MAG: hypothetical protein PHE67_05315 [Campylobacterales bacterium]|nr:hypothetical protein [Campylobacterales bacterium]
MSTKLFLVTKGGAYVYPKIKAFFSGSRLSKKEKARIGNLFGPMPTTRRWTSCYIPDFKRDWHDFVKGWIIPVHTIEDDDGIEILGDGFEIFENVVFLEDGQAECQRSVKVEGHLQSQSRKFDPKDEEQRLMTLYSLEWGFEGVIPTCIQKIMENRASRPIVF